MTTATIIIVAAFLIFGELVKLTDHVRAQSRKQVIYPAWCCHKCGAPIGLLGRLMDWFLSFPLHHCIR